MRVTPKAMAAAKPHWSDDDVVVLRENWGTMSAVEIGKKVNKTDNAVISKAHRLNLPMISRDRATQWAVATRETQQRPPVVSSAANIIPFPPASRRGRPPVRLMHCHDWNADQRPRPWHPLYDAKPDWLSHRQPTTAAKKKAR